MRSKHFSCAIAGALVATLALASPALAFRGGGGGGMHFGGMGGGMHFGGMGGGMHFGGMGSGMHFGTMGSGPGFGSPHFSGGRFVGARFAHPAFSPRFSGIGLRDRGHIFFHNRFRRFAFVGAPFVTAGYAGYYDGCWRRAWTPYGWRWANACSDYYPYQY